MLGLAIGDALGMPVEGAHPAALRRHFPHGLREFLPAPARGLGPGQWTDDTQMMLMHAESIVATGRVDPEDIARRFVAWMESGEMRGPGRTTVWAIRNLRRGLSWRESGIAGPMRAGNGVAMRIAPVGLFLCRDLDALREAVERAGIITHREPESVHAARAVAYAVARLARGDADLDTLLDDVIGFIGPSQTAENIARAQTLLAANVPPDEALAELGTTAWAVHTAAAAFYCFLRTPGDFEETVVAAVMGGHDTDTTAAVAGAISGAYNGVEIIPARWREGVEDGERIAELAGEIYWLAANHCTGPGGGSPGSTRGVPSSSPHPYILGIAPNCRAISRSRHVDTFSQT